MVCACHRFGLFPMARTNHTLPRNIRTQLYQISTKHVSSLKFKSHASANEVHQFQGGLSLLPDCESFLLFSGAGDCGC